MVDGQPGTRRAQQRRLTEERILAAARQEFAASGYDRATIRTIAGLAGVNPGVISHYFGSKEDLFRHAESAPPEEEPELDSPERLAARLLAALDVPTGDVALPTADALRAMLVDPPDVVGARLEIAASTHGLAGAIETDDGPLRAALVATTILGAVVGRHLLQLEPLRAATPDAIIELLRPLLRGLTHDASSPAATQPFTPG